MSRFEQPDTGGDGAGLAGGDSNDELSARLALVLLQSGEARRQSIDQMMWQVPGLSLTAQSFLLTISLGHLSSGWARAVAGALGLVTSLATIQLLLRHRYHELEWSYWLEHFSGGHKLNELNDMHDPVRRRELAWQRLGKNAHDWRHNDAQRRFSPLWRTRRAVVSPSSVNVWTAALLIFAVADLGAAAAGLATVC